ncbi:hypothetical protein K474DRAFT_1676758 [Panus rudis PR-1116 ss-1]|nr:hypothetical protein K474DRAFT_1676758 [Panus rudis PR-1116 ss-1]
MNVLSGTFLVRNWYKGTRFLHNLPVRFGITAFWKATQFDKDDHNPKVFSGRTELHMPPEARHCDHWHQPYDPFTSDVYQLGIVFISYFAEMTIDIPEMGLVFEQMTRLEPHKRISMREAAILFDDIIQMHVFRPLQLGAMFDLQTMGVLVRPEEEDRDDMEEVPDSERDSDSDSESEGEI